MSATEFTLVADRFVREARRWGTDLATGHRVRLLIVTDASAAALAFRRARCEALSSLQHPHLLTLIDHGPIGSDRWFEAWAVSSRARPGRGRRIVEALRAAVSFLHASGLSAGRADLNRAGECRGQVVLRPDAGTGRALLSGRHSDAEARAWGALLPRGHDTTAGLVGGSKLVAPAELKWVTDVLDDARPGEVRSVCLQGREWFGFRLLIARAARARGFIPVDLELLQRWPQIGARLRGRHFMLLASDDAGRTVGRLLSQCLLNPNACVVVRRTREAPDARAVLAPDGGSIERAPGCVREARPVYDMVGPTSPDSELAPLTPGAMRAPAARRGRRAVERAAALIECGRHAAAERRYRSAIGRLERRGLARDAAAGRLALAEHLGRRARAREAIEVLTCAQAHDDPALTVRAAISVASFLTDEARLTEAESSARWARLAAGGCDDPGLLTQSAVALARSLFWQGRFDEASACLPDAATHGQRGYARASVYRTRILLARGDITSAGRAAAAGGRVIPTPGDPAAEVVVHLAMADVRAWIGDEPGFRHHLGRAGEIAQTLRAPLERLRVLLTLAQGAVALDLRAERPQVDRALRRWERRLLPALWRVRVQHARGCLGHRESAAAARRAAGTHGIGVLLRPRGPEGRTMDALQELADILQICHESPDERTALTRTSATLRDRLRARSVGILGPEGGAIAGAGPGWGDRSAVTSRVATTGRATGPILEDGGLEAAAPIRYAGRTIAVAIARWTVDAALDHTHVGSVLSTAAAASAPSVRAWLDRQAAPGPACEAAMPALLGTSHAIELVRQAALRAARAPFSVLVEGESGSGKELVARAIHMSSERRERRFCTINCAALTDELLEAELFGHARGAFTGAVAERPGLFEDADQGTLLLDELSELSPRAQAKLLRALQDGEIRRVGENLPRRVDVRIIGASNRPLAEQVASGRFRADLRYRLDVIRIVVPPLRERVEDIPLLAAHFWGQATRRTRSRATLDPETLAALAHYDWPGNVRELQNAMTALAVQAGSRGRVGPEALPEHLARGRALCEPATLEQARESFERRFVRATLASVGGHRGQAARTLGVTRQGLAKLIKRLGIDEPHAAAQESARAVS